MCVCVCVSVCVCACVCVFSNVTPSEYFKIFHLLPLRMLVNAAIHYKLLLPVTKKMSVPATLCSANAVELAYLHVQCLQDI